VLYSPADWLPFLAELADEADRISLQFFRKTGLRVGTKPDQSPVSEADAAIEAMVRKLTMATHPALGLLGEEEGETAGQSATRLIVDPIDGTRNYVRGIPVYATLLAVEQESEVIAGMVSAPALHARWHAARGAGAWRGNRRLMVSGVNNWDQAQLFFGGFGGSEGERLPPGLLALGRRCQRTRGFGDFWQHALLAEGAGEVAVDPDVRPWDIAAVQVLVEEAGGRATTLAGARSVYGGSLVTSNGLLHDGALALLERSGQA
jgi:histidinol-phosphatase